MVPKTLNVWVVSTLLNFMTLMVIESVRNLGANVKASKVAMLAHVVLVTIDIKQFLKVDKSVKKKIDQLILLGWLNRIWSVDLEE